MRCIELLYMGINTEQYNMDKAKDDNDDEMLMMGYHILKRRRRRRM